MKKVLVVIDMQEDFVRAALATPEAQAIISNVANKIEAAALDNTEIIFTRDTHQTNYMDTLEGKHLPVPHCIEGTKGWEIIEELYPFTLNHKVINKPNFGSTILAKEIEVMCPTEVELIGVCTDICVVSNALILKATLPETPVIVDASCCAGVTPETHKAALTTMKMCQVNVINDDE